MSLDIESKRNPVNALSTLRLATITLSAAFIIFLGARILMNQGDQIWNIRFFGVLLSFMGVSLFSLLPGSPLQYIGFWAALMVFLYHGGPELALIAEQSTTSYRITGRVTENAAAWGAVIAGTFNLLFSAYYVIFRSSVRHFFGEKLDSSLSRRMWIDNVPGSLLVGWVLASYLYLGGLKNTFPSDSSVGYALTAILMYPLLPILTLFYVKVIRWISIERLKASAGVLILGLLTLFYVFVINERISLLVAIFSALYICEAYRITKVSLRQLALTGLVVLISFAGLVVVRNAVGREAITSGSPIERITLVWNSLIRGERDKIPGLSNASDADKVKQDFAYRLDSNGFLGLIATTTAVDRNEPDFHPVTIAARLAIPSALWGSKLQLSVAERSPEQYIVNRFWFPNRNLDYLPTFIAIFYGMGGVPFGGVFVLAVIVLLGAPLLVFVEVFSLSNNNVFSGMLIVTVMNCIVFIERDIMQWPIAVRNLLIIWIVFAIAKNLPRFKVRSRDG